LHGVVVADPYRWLEDEKSPEVKEWMTAQDALTRAALAKLPGRDAIATRAKELFYIDSLGPPQHRGPRYFYTRRHATKEKAIVYWKQGKQGAEKVLFDPNIWSADGSVSLGTWSVSWDGRRVAYSVRKNNADEATLYVLDVATAKRSEVDVIEGAKYALASWTPRGDGFYYTWLPTDPKIPTAERPGYAEVRFHKLGQDPKTDRIVHERTGDPTRFLNVDLSRDGHWLLVSVQHGWSSEDVYFRDLRTKAGASAPFRSLAVGQDAFFNIHPWQDRLYVLTNWKAPHWRVLRVDPAHPDLSSWHEIVPARDDAILEGMSVVGGRLALRYLKDATSRLEVHELGGARVREIKLPTLGTASGLLGNEDEDEAYFTFESYTYPVEIYSTSLKTGDTKLWYRLKVPVDPSPYEVEQVFYSSKDGTRVPMFIVHRKDLKKDGSAPTILTGYGGFQISETPYFRKGFYPWLERGGVFALACLRGGGEYGEEWHRAGWRNQKQNVFDDFIAAAEFLARAGYTRPERLAILGGSNGGLLVGAALTQRPDLFRVALCAVPLLDMVRYHLFGSGKTWIEEYGSAEQAAQFKALYAYSPYHHVKPGARYPAVLLLSADSDDRVDPMHARKFAAALQAASAGGPVLLRIERNSGHGGADLVKQAVEQLADEYAFALAQMGVDAGSGVGTGAAPPPGISK